MAPVVVEDLAPPAQQWQEPERAAALPNNAAAKMKAVPQEVDFPPSEQIDEPLDRTMPAAASSPRHPYDAFSPPVEQDHHPAGHILDDNDCRSSSAGSGSASQCSRSPCSKVNSAGGGEERSKTRARKGPKERARLRARREREQRAAGQQHGWGHAASGGGDPQNNWDDQRVWVSGTTETLNPSWNGTLVPSGTIRPHFSHPPRSSIFDYRDPTQSSSTASGRRWQRLLPAAVMNPNRSS